MALRDWFRRTVPAQTSNGVAVQYRDLTDPALLAYESQVLGMAPETLWRTQPYLRTVVNFLARNIAQLALQSYQRVSDTDRRRIHDDPLPRLLRNPNDRMTTYELVTQLVADLALYDEAFWFLTEATDRQEGWLLEPIPPGWITTRGGSSIFEPEWYDVQPVTQPVPQRIPASDLIVFRGWNPATFTVGSSPVVALKQILAEQIHAAAYRQQVWQRGGRVGTVLSRPATAPQWSNEARTRFQEDWRANWTSDQGPKAGGTPLLEDGMTLQQVGFSAHEQEFVEAAKLSLSIVASTYHVNPTMVGVLDNANYSNVREFRRMLYGDTLGPTIAMIEDRVNTFMVPRVATTPDLYTEFNIAEKLQGSFEEQASAMSTSIGRPWMTADEGRALVNLPALGGDAAQLVTPLNVLVGGQAAPTDSGSQNLASHGPVRTKARGHTGHERKYEQVLAAYFERQARVVQTRLGAKADADWWDAERWDGELADDLYRLAVQASHSVAVATLHSIGFGPDAYDTSQTLAFLRAVSERQAGAINGATKNMLDAALASTDPAQGVRDVFDRAQAQRVPSIAATALSAASGFGTTEAARQVSGEKATKTWVAGSNPRPAHAAMDGQTVGINEAFSNGLAWPGDGWDMDQIAGCNCAVDVHLP